MKKVYLKGYINLGEENFTFIYEDRKLTLISLKHQPTFFNEYRYINYLEGFTLEGFDIVFYVNSEIYYKSGCYICSPRCIFISQNKEYHLAEMKFSSLKFTGETLNRFYSNRNMIDIDFDNYITNVNECIKIKSPEESVSEEIVELNGKQTKFELSIMQPGFIDDGCITFNDYNTLLRVKYDAPLGYSEIVHDIGEICNFFRFCSNRNNITFDTLFLECQNNNNKYFNAVEIIIPYMIDKKINKNMITYDLVNNHISDIIKFLKNCDYVYSIIPEDDKEYEFVSNKDYCASFSCFESIYQFIHGSSNVNELLDDEIELEEIKKEILPFLQSLDEKYKGKNKLRREFVQRFNNLISKANLKLEKCLLNELQKHDYLIDTIYYKRRDKIKEIGIKEAVKKAVNERDDITHNTTIKLDDVSIGVWEIVLKLNYIMIFNYVGISHEEIKKSISYLSIRSII